MDRTTFALRILAAACLLGLAGDLLLKDAAWGVNFTIFVFIVVAAGAWLVKRSPSPLERSVFWFAAPLLLFAAMLAWRDSEELKLANVIAVLIAGGAMAARSHKGKVWLASVVDYSFLAACHWAASPFYFGVLTLDDIKWSQHSSSVKSGKAAAITRGLLLATPIVLVFGGLFASADANFKNIIDSMVALDAEELILHLFVFGLITVLVGGMLRSILMPPDPNPPPVVTPPYPVQPMEPVRLGITEIGIILGSINAVFGLFVAIQFTHFFGGHSLVQSTKGLTYADYARGGFFELVAVAAITLVLLLGLHALLDKREAAHENIFRWLSRLLVGFAVVVMISAFSRMSLYVESYGLTILRLYTSAFMIWLGLCFLWLVVTVLNGRDNRFAFGAVVAGFVVILGLNLMNPDAAIVRVNTAMGGKALDVDYLASLSADAVPDLKAAMPAMPADKREALEGALKDRWSERSTDWREFNLSRWNNLD